MTKFKKVTLKRLEKLVQCQTEIENLLDKIGDDAFNSDIRIGVRRYSASMIISDYRREAAINKKYYQTLRKCFLDEYEQD